MIALALPPWHESSTKPSRKKKDPIRWSEPSENGATANSIFIYFIILSFWKSLIYIRVLNETRMKSLLINTLRVGMRERWKYEKKNTKQSEILHRFGALQGYSSEADLAAAGGVVVYCPPASYNAAPTSSSCLPASITTNSGNRHYS